MPSTYANEAEYAAVLEIAKTEVKSLIAQRAGDIYLNADVLRAEAFDVTLTEIDSAHSDLHHLEAYVVSDIVADAVAEVLVEGMTPMNHPDEDPPR